MGITNARRRTCSPTPPGRFCSGSIRAWKAWIWYSSPSNWMKRSATFTVWWLLYLGQRGRTGDGPGNGNFSRLNNDQQKSSAMNLERDDEGQLLEHHSNLNRGRIG